MSKKLKPFDLQAALKGEPVKLRDGRKAYVRHHETELPVDESVCLTGFTANGYKLTWCENGDYCNADEPYDYNIIGMYPETRIINGFEVPTPEKEEPALGDTYYPALTSEEEFCSDRRWDDDPYDNRMLKRGLVFLNKEDAVANAKAMLGIDPDSAETEWPDETRIDAIGRNGNDGGHYWQINSGVFPDIDPKTRVIVEDRNGEREESRAENFCWRLEGSDSDIIRWRLA